MTITQVISSSQVEDSTAVLMQHSLPNQDLIFCVTCNSQVVPAVQFDPKQHMGHAVCRAVGSCFGRLQQLTDTIIQQAHCFLKFITDNDTTDEQLCALHNRMLTPEFLRALVVCVLFPTSQQQPSAFDAVAEKRCNFQTMKQLLTSTRRQVLGFAQSNFQRDQLFCDIFPQFLQHNQNYLAQNTDFTSQCLSQSEFRRGSFQSAALQLIKKFQTDKAIADGCWMRCLGFEPVTSESLVQLTELEAQCQRLAVDPDRQYENGNEIGEPLKQQLAEAQAMYFGAFATQSIDDAIICAAGAVEQVLKLVRAANSGHKFTVVAPITFAKYALNACEAHKHSLVEFFQKLEQKVQSLHLKVKLDDIIEVLMTPLINQMMTTIYVELGQEFKQNCQDFDHIVQQLNSVLDLKLIQLLTYYTISQYAVSYPKVGEIIEKIYKSDYQKNPLVLVNFLNALNFIPKPENSENFLKHIAIQIDPKRRVESKAFSQSNLLNVIQKCFKRNGDSWLFVGQEYFEPSVCCSQLEAHLSHFSANHTTLPQTIKTPLVNRHISCAGIVSSVTDVLKMYEDNTVSFAQAALALRLQSLTKWPIDVKGAKSCQLNAILHGEQQTTEQKPKIDVRQKVQNLKRSGVVELMSEKIADATEECCCDMCHQVLKKDTVIPISVYSSPVDDAEIIDFCRHQYHKSCGRKLKRKHCSVCNFEFDSMRPIATDEELVNSQIRLLKYVFTHTNATLIKPKILRELEKLRFLSIYNKAEISDENKDILDLSRELWPAEAFEEFKETMRDGDAEAMFCSEVFKECTTEFGLKEEATCSCDDKITSNYVICIKCGQHQHESCGMDDDFNCPCGFRYCYCPRLSIIYSHRKMVLRSPYLDYFGQQLTQASQLTGTLDKALLEELKLNIITHQSHQDAIEQLINPIAITDRARQAAHTAQTMLAEGFSREEVVFVFESLPEAEREQARRLMEEGDGESNNDYDDGDGDNEDRFWELLREIYEAKQLERQDQETKVDEMFYLFEKDVAFEEIEELHELLSEEEQMVLELRIRAYTVEKERIKALAKVQLEKVKIQNVVDKILNGSNFDEQMATLEAMQKLEALAKLRELSQGGTLTQAQKEALGARFQQQQEAGGNEGPHAVQYKPRSPQDPKPQQQDEEFY